MLNENEKIVLRHIYNVEIEHSDDPDTKVGVILQTDEGVIEVANELPLGIYEEGYKLRKPNKYDWIEHAERTAIAEAARLGYATQGAYMFMRWYPCFECAKSIINSGIKKLYCQPHTIEDQASLNHPRYKFGISQKMLQESSVEIIPWTDEDIKELY